MNFKRSVIAVTLLGSLCASAWAQHGKSREEVKAELADAVRNGDIISGEHSQTLREMYPSVYPAQPQTIGRTRDDVKRELAEAIRNGEIIATGETGLTLSELYPRRFPHELTSVGKTRQEVKSELTAAIRAGEVVYGERGPTFKEKFPESYRRATISSH
jgi:Domain of unknown function (DUF4148)